MRLLVQCKWYAGVFYFCSAWTFKLDMPDLNFFGINVASGYIFRMSVKIMSRLQFKDPPKGLEVYFEMGSAGVTCQWSASLCFLVNVTVTKHGLVEENTLIIFICVMSSII